MRYITLITISFILLLGACGNKKASSKEAEQVTDMPQIIFVKKEHSFGKIDKNRTDSVSFDFVFKNTGDLPIIIQKVDVSCGCLSAIYTEAPVKKDSIGFVKIVVNPKKVEGHFKKSIFVKSNAIKDVELLKVDGIVF